MRLGGRGRRHLQPSLRAHRREPARARATRVAVDTQALAEVESYFTRLAQAEGLPSGSPQGFDAGYQHHQLPGGMVGTMRRHLQESRIAHLEGAVIEELGRVRQELGWPIVMTPFSQILLTQAVMNVTSRERYSVVPDELIRYAIGRFGKPTVPIEPGVMERIESLPRTRELEAEPPMAPLEELRRRLGENLSRTRSSCCAPPCRRPRWMPCWRRVPRRGITTPRAGRRWI